MKNVRFAKVNSMPTIEEHITLNLSVDQAISKNLDESSLLGLDPDEKLKIDEQKFRKF